MTVDELHPAKTAILFFDILNGYFHGGDTSMSEVKRSMVGHAVRLMKAGRVAGLPIFFAKVNHRSDGATASQLRTDTDNALKPWPNGIVVKTRARVSGDDKSSDPIPELEPQAGDYFIPKYRWNAFFQTALDLSLRSRGIDTVIISGGSTEIGLTATVFGGRDLDYNMIVVRDACASFHNSRAHDTLMELVFPRMSRVRTTDQVLSMLSRATGARM
jgi:ureidoacrylate peracid hydrolase